jgi:transcription initiation factor TFIIH subunit 2
MADSENEYSDDEIIPGRGRAAASNPKRAHARWENLATNTHGLDDAANGSMEGVLGGIEEANKRRRCVCILHHLT